MLAADEDKARLLLRLTGLAMVIPEALPRVEALARQFQPVTAFSLAALLVFAGCFWVMTRDRGPARRVGVAVLALETAIALGVASTGGGTFDAALLVVVATQLLIVLRLAEAAVWLAGQIAAMCLLYLRQHPASHDAFSNFLLPQSFFQVFALGVVLLLRRVEDARAEVARVNAELLATRGLLEDSSRALERLRISRELHDGVGHYLTALGLKLEVAARKAPPALSPVFDELRAFAGQVHAEVRQSVAQLRDEPAMDLRRALRSLVEGVEHPRVHLSVAGDLPVLSPAEIHVLFRSVQEAVTNTLRHAGAQNLWIDCRRAGAGVEVQARDDGRGMGGAREGNGLRGMRERVGELGGTVAFVPAERGLTMRIHLPARALASEGS